VAELCSCCGHPATHHFAVSYRGQVLRGAICEEHGNAVARERLGIQDRPGSLGGTKIGRALTDPLTKPHFQRIREREHQEIVCDTTGLSSKRAFENGFSTHRRRSMSRWRRSRLRGSEGQPAGVDPAGVDPAGVDIALVMVPETVHQGPAALKPDNERIPDSFLIIDGHGGADGGLGRAAEDDPIRVKIVDAIKVLDKYAVPLKIGEKKADQLLKQHGETIVRSTLRAAIKERRQFA
jgi:hypothetical protein